MFQIGDKVRLKEGGPVMKVDAIRNAKGEVIELGPGWDNITYCRWFDGGKPEGYGFMTDRLERCSLEEVDANKVAAFVEVMHLKPRDVLVLQVPNGQMDAYSHSVNSWCQVLPEGVKVLLLPEDCAAQHGLGYHHPTDEQESAGREPAEDFDAVMAKILPDVCLHAGWVHVGVRWLEWFWRLAQYHATDALSIFEYVPDEESATALRKAMQAVVQSSNPVAIPPMMGHSLIAPLFPLYRLCEDIWREGCSDVLVQTVYKECQAAGKCQLEAALRLTLALLKSKAVLMEKYVHLYNQGRGQPGPGEGLPPIRAIHVNDDDSFDGGYATGPDVPIDWGPPPQEKTIKAPAFIAGDRNYVPELDGRGVDSGLRMTHGVSVTPSEASDIICPQCELSTAVIRFDHKHVPKLNGIPERLNSAGSVRLGDRPGHFQICCCHCGHGFYAKDTCRCKTLLGGCTCGFVEREKERKGS